VLVAFQAQQETKEPRVTEDHKVFRVHKGPRETQVLREQLAHKVCKAHKEPREIPVLKGPEALKER
jgi:hypothetical protein